MGKVRLEIMPSLAETLGMDDVSEVAVSDPDPEGVKSVGELLSQLSTKYERFRIVFDFSTRELTGRVHIFLNGRSLVNGLETRLRDGDTLTLVPVIEGG